MKSIHLIAYATIASFSTFHCDYSELAKIAAEWMLVWSLSAEVMGERRVARLLRILLTILLVGLVLRTALAPQVDHDPVVSPVVAVGRSQRPEDLRCSA